MNNSAIRVACAEILGISATRYKFYYGERNIQCKGWLSRDRAEYERVTLSNQGFTATQVVEYDDPESRPDFVFSADAALTLCDALRKAGWSCNLSDGLDGTWECEFSRPPTEATNPDDIGTRNGERLEIHYGAADTASAAICIAALKAHGTWQEEWAK